MVKLSVDSRQLESVQENQSVKCVTELRDPELHLTAIDLHLRELCVRESQVWTWLGGEWRGGQFVIIWVTTCLTDMLPHWPPFVLWTDNKTVCVCVTECEEGGKKKKNDNVEGGTLKGEAGFLS